MEKAVADGTILAMVDDDGNSSDGGRGSRGRSRSVSPSSESARQRPLSSGAAVRAAASHGEVQASSSSPGGPASLPGRGDAGPRGLRLQDSAHRSVTIAAAAVSPAAAKLSLPPRPSTAAPAGRSGPPLGGVLAAAPFLSPRPLSSAAVNTRVPSAAKRPSSAAPLRPSSAASRPSSARPSSARPMSATV